MDRADIAAMGPDEQRELRERIKQEPEIHAFIKAVNENFPGARVAYIRLGGDEWGTPPLSGPIYPGHWVPPIKPDKKGRRK